MYYAGNLKHKFQEFDALNHIPGDSIYNEEFPFDVQLEIQY